MKTQKCMAVVIVLLILIFALNVIDYIQTVYAIQLFGIGVEVNPIGRFLFEHNCAWVAKFIALPLMLTALGFIVKIERRQAWAVYGLTVYYFLLIMHNFVMLARVGVL